MYIKKAVIPLILTAFALSAFGCDVISESIPDSNFSTAQTTATPSVTTAISQTEATVTTVTEPIHENPSTHFFAVGDNLIHSSIYEQAAARSTDGTYDFDYAYENVAGLIPQEGIRVINQETLVCNDEFQPSSYPCFNSPTQLGDKMISLGFNVFNHANNHVLDKGIKGLLATFDYWESRNAMWCGAYRNDEDMNNIRLVKDNDIVFSFLGFTEHTNGINLPSDTDVRVIYTSNVEEIQRQIKAASELSDVVVVNVHWGVENSNNVTEAQRTLARQMADWGADIIVGTHPHTIQTIEAITNNNGETALVFYSLGNFISAQSVKNLMVGMAVDFDVTVDWTTREVSFTDIKSIPIITQYEGSYKNIRNYPYYLYTDELANTHGLRSSGFSFDYLNGLVADIIPEDFLCLTQP